MLEYASSVNLTKVQDFFCTVFIFLFFLPNPKQAFSDSAKSQQRCLSESDKHLCVKHGLRFGFRVFPLSLFAKKYQNQEDCPVSIITYCAFFFIKSFVFFPFIVRFDCQQ